MACYSPLQAFRLLDSYHSVSGKNLIVFSHPVSGRFEHLQLPCSRCIGCRLEYSRQWAIRCVHESRLYDHNCFVTLTFDDTALFSRSNPFSLCKRDFQLFMKRLRKRFGSNIRYFIVVSMVRSYLVLIIICVCLIWILKISTIGEILMGVYLFIAPLRVIS